MAEAVAGAIVAEQIVSTGIEAGAVAAVARPTLPLKATLSPIPEPCQEAKYVILKEVDTEAGLT